MNDEQLEEYWSYVRDERRKLLDEVHRLHAERLQLLEQRQRLLRDYTNLRIIVRDTAAQLAVSAESRALSDASRRPISI